MSHPDGLTAEQRTLVDHASRALVASQVTGAAMTRGDVGRDAHNRAHERASRALADAEDAGVPPEVLDGAIAAVHRADRPPVLAALRSDEARA